LCCLGDILFRHNHTKPGSFPFSPTPEYKKVLVGNPKIRFLKNILIGFGVQQAAGFRESLIHLGHFLLLAGKARPWASCNAYESGRQTGATFCPSAIQYLFAGFGGHTGAEPVSSFTLDNAWLKCSFHNGSWETPNKYSCLGSQPMSPGLTLVDFGNP